MRPLMVMSKCLRVDCAIQKSQSLSKIVFFKNDNPDLGKHYMIALWT